MIDKAERTESGDIIIVRTDDYVIDLTQMLFNWRLHVATAEDYGKTYVHGYCYFGKTYLTGLKAFTAGIEWATGDPLTSQPPGFDKEAF